MSVVGNFKTQGDYLAWASRAVRDNAERRQAYKDASDSTAAVATLAKGLRDARSSCTALVDHVWDENALAEMCWNWIQSQPATPR